MKRIGFGEEEEVDPPERLTRDDVQEMIDDAIRMKQS